MSTADMERIDVAASDPGKLAVLQALFDRKAQSIRACPLINWADMYRRFSVARKQGAMAPTAI